MCYGQGFNFSLFFVIIPSSQLIFFSENESSDLSLSHQSPKNDFLLLSGWLIFRPIGNNEFHFSLERISFHLEKSYILLRSRPKSTRTC